MTQHKDTDQGPTQDGTTRFERWWARRTGEHGESAITSFVIMLVLLPMIVAAFGLGFDIARNTFIRTSLQNDLDSAVVGAAAVTGTYSSGPNRGSIYISPSGASSAARTAYAYNRTNSPSLSCIGSGSVAIPGGAVAKCWQDISGPSVYNGCVVSSSQDCRIRWEVRERSTNQFVSVIGVQYQYYNLQSEAVLEWENY